MKQLFENKIILVTGGCGSIGSEIVKQLLTFDPKSIRVLDTNESNLFYLGQELDNKKIRLLLGDVRDRDRMYRAMKDVDIVFHAAALKHVPLCEYNPLQAVHTNVIGTENVISAAIDNNVDRVVGISTDKAVNPISTMGATKLLSEKVMVDISLSESNTKFSCVRFGNVLDSVGSVIPIFRKQIQKGGPVTITHKDMTRFFMTNPDAISLVIKAASTMQGGEVFILKMKAMKIPDLAEVMITELAPKYKFEPNEIKIEYMGKRYGEKMHEALMTAEESAKAEETDSMYILTHQPSVSKDRDSSKRVDSGNHEYLSKEQIKQLLLDAKII